MAEQRRRPPERPAPRRPGLYEGELVDAVGRIYHVISDEIGGDRAAAIVAAGGQVVVDECGCGGYCGLEWLSAAQRAELRAKGGPHPRGSNKRGRPAGWLTELAADDGRPVLLVSGKVRWSPGSTTS